MQDAQEPKPTPKPEGQQPQTPSNGVAREFAASPFATRADKVASGFSPILRPTELPTAPVPPQAQPTAVDHDAPTQPYSAAELGQIQHDEDLVQRTRDLAIANMPTGLDGFASDMFPVPPVMPKTPQQTAPQLPVNPQAQPAAEASVPPAPAPEKKSWWKFW
jgi:hypothetical protein